MMTRGESGSFFDSEANISSYVKFQLEDGSNVHVYRFNTTKEQEQEIAKRAELQQDPRGMNCASMVSSAINGIGPFKDLGHYRTPRALGNALRDLQEKLNAK
jgi:hypothetical protein